MSGAVYLGGIKCAFPLAPPPPPFLLPDPALLSNLSPQARGTYFILSPVTKDKHTQKKETSSSPLAFMVHVLRPCFLFDPQERLLGDDGSDLILSIGVLLPICNFLRVVWFSITADTQDNNRLGGFCRAQTSVRFTSPPLSPLLMLDGGWDEEYKEGLPL